MDLLRIIFFGSPVVALLIAGIGWHLGKSYSSSTQKLRTIFISGIVSCLYFGILFLAASINTYNFWHNDFTIFALMYFDGHAVVLIGFFLKFFYIVLNATTVPLIIFSLLITNFIVGSLIAWVLCLLTRVKSISIVLYALSMQVLIGVVVGGFALSNVGPL